MKRQWVAVVPVKALDTAKTRLTTVPDMRRRELALAFAVDTVTALQGVDCLLAVVAVGGDDDLAADLTHRRVVVLAEPVPGGLNQAAQAGIDWARGRHPQAGILVVPADLPALRSADVARVLAMASAHARAVLPDREGTGTTMLTGLPPTPPVPRFGRGSLARHLATGAVALDATGLERAAYDVDTAVHLEQARALGVGAATGQVLGDAR